MDKVDYMNEYSIEVIKRAKSKFGQYYSDIFNEQNLGSINYIIINDI